MKSNDLKRAKREVRRAVLERRDALGPAEREAAGLAIAERCAGLARVGPGATVMAFWSFGSEVPTGPLLRRLQGVGVTVGLPRIDEEDLRIVTYRDGDLLTATAFGAMEPVDGAEIEPAALDLIATPAVAFDRWGRRIGYGGGFYDRLFPRAASAMRLGLAYDLQVLDEPLPAGHFDIRVHAICTPTRIIECADPT